MARERKISTEELYQTTKQLLLDRGYDGYTFTLLANRLDVSRAAIYKYYENKEELLSEYMVYELQTFIDNLKIVNQEKSFFDQFHALFNYIFNDMSIYRIREIGMQIPTVNQKVAENKHKLEKMHNQLYTLLQKFIEFGKSEKVLKEDLPSSLVLGLIFQTVNIPNLERIPHSEWVEKMKEIMCHGMFNKE
ncbi:TetR/AcrR family transcriptional regulator [Ornithinibacillus bavariensis]|uniref:TetR/AcrR family transcriptional regulator n=1 Tax=Ornithinibacillus bavariensis TaxID=545502 RepID=UPI000ECFA2F5|nr:TetR/AcrR family transcriptional regulator [Ornithinibacillus sp.]